MLEAVRSHVRWVDVFCETGAFDVDQSRAVLEAGRSAGLGLRLHANQLDYGPGVRLGVEMGCASVDHCTYLSDDDLEMLAASDTVATFLPAADFSTRQPYPDARRAIDAGVQGGARLELQSGLQLHDVDLVLHSAGGARYAHDDRRGCRGGHHRRRRPPCAEATSARLTPGGPAHLTILDAPSRHHLAYRPGVPLIWRTLGSDYRLPSADNEQ